MPGPLTLQIARPAVDGGKLVGVFNRGERRNMGVPEGWRTGRAGERPVLRDTCSDPRKRDRDVARYRGKA